MMGRLTHLGTDLLGKGRLSLPGGRYFITICTCARKSDLEKSAVARSLLETVQRMEADGDLDLTCATVMPDHVHLLFTLGN